MDPVTLALRFDHSIKMESVVEGIVKKASFAEIEFAFCGNEFLWKVLLIVAHPLLGISLDEDLGHIGFAEAEIRMEG